MYFHQIEGVEFIYKDKLFFFDLFVCPCRQQGGNFEKTTRETTNDWFVYFTRSKKQTKTRAFYAS